ncbi:hypothetical protein [Streptomyces sp. NPDC058872]|uniref:hypothetical protein n=1 Tax=Streptomyces sp. NPDC058872 TaxID=3346661 RepID=UPI0036789B0E
MRSEADTPLVERVLRIESRADGGALEAFGRCLPRRSANEVALFLSHCYAEIPVGKIYDVCFRCAEERAAVRVAATVVAVTQQFGVAWDEIPHGWNTLTVVRFEPEVPVWVRELPETGSWYDRPSSLLLASRETWAARTLTG